MELFSDAFLGMAGLPRRYYDNSAYEGFSQLIEINEVVSFFAITGAVVQLIFFFNFFYSMFRGRKSPAKSMEIQYS